MKKFKSLFISLALSTCVFASSCSFVNAMTQNPSNTAEIKANYTEMTAESQAQVVKFLEDNVSETTLFGDPQKETWKNGVSLTFDVDYDARSGEEYTTLKTNGNVKLAVSKNSATTTDELSLASFSTKAIGNVTLKYSNYFKDPVEDTYQKQRCSLTANAYIDNAVAYADYDISILAGDEENKQSAGVKFATEDLLEWIYSGLYSEDEALPTSTETENATIAETLNGLFASLDEYGLKAYYELSNEKGLVLKISATQTTIDKLLEEEVLSSDTKFVVTPTCDLYLAIDNTGKLTKLSVDVDVALTYKINDQIVTTSLKAFFLLETSETLTVTLPSGLAENELYKDFNNNEDSSDDTQVA